MKKADDPAVAVYVRVSTTEQKTEAQEAELLEFAERRGWKVAKVFRDSGYSGVSKERPALNELMALCRRRKFDVVVVWRFDRFARSMEQLASALSEFHDLGIDFVSMNEAIDTTTTTGRMVFFVMAALAAFERDLIRDRVRSGLANARKKGVLLGRPPLVRLTPQQIEDIRRAYRRKTGTMKTLATKYGTSAWTIHKLVNQRS